MKGNRSVSRGWEFGDAGDCLVEERERRPRRSSGLAVPSEKDVVTVAKHYSGVVEPESVPRAAMA